MGKRSKRESYTSPIEPIRKLASNRTDHLNPCSWILGVVSVLLVQKRDIERPYCEPVHACRIPATDAIDSFTHMSVKSGSMLPSPTGLDSIAIGAHQDPEQRECARYKFVPRSQDEHKAHY
ncbi:uncharacterized protein B0T23DRAFT_392590 [Neurospora hispaniola]|uniref:Uncharacterized protein n=1 Tax=Neurospora hispaniola TaxID=588809 RepID=A0AAJ0IGM9_9PEZI|nr:hypothetical protein B0T23DRAFT_392590 [Neurospora hispaniola]